MQEHDQRFFVNILQYFHPVLEAAKTAEHARSENERKMLEHDGWKYVKIHTGFNTYVGVAFVNEKEKIVLNVHNRTRNVTATFTEFIPTALQSAGHWIDNLTRPDISPYHQITDAFTPALEFTQSLMKEYEGYRIIHMGFSRGGGTAQSLGIYLNQDFIAYDPPGADLKFVVQNDSDGPDTAFWHLQNFEKELEKRRAQFTGTGIVGRAAGRIGSIVSSVGSHHPKTVVIHFSPLPEHASLNPLDLHDSKIVYDRL